MIREDIKKVLEAINDLEGEIVRDGNEPNDFGENEWLDMVEEELRRQERI